MIRPLTLLFFTLFIGVSNAKNFYVDIAGSDEKNTGTLASPFRTIQKAASQAVAGDTIFIRKGIYRETVTPTNSGAAEKPIVFTSYQNEEVTISATNAVTNWVLEKKHASGKVWKAKMNGTLNTGTGISAAGMDQVFVDGVMQTEARWPNITVNPATVDRSTYAIADSAKLQGTYVNDDIATAKYTDADIAKLPSNLFNDAYIHLFAGYFWWPATGKITSHEGNTLTFTYRYRSGVYYEPREKDIYYVWGKYDLLDAPGEWFRKNDDTLFLYTPKGDSPNNHLIEVKKRNDVLDLRGKAYITLKKIKLLGGGIKTDKLSIGLHVDEIDARYMSHYSIVPGWWNIRYVGVVLNGANSVVSNSHIAYTVEDGIKLNGNNSKAYNNVIHDAGYLGMSGILLGCSGDNMELKNNTVWGSGGANALDFRHSTRSKIWYNDAAESGKGTFDGGILMGTRDFDGQNTEVAYNYIHDGKGIADGSRGFYATSGIYFEGNMKNYLVHHNIIWNVTGAGINIPNSKDNYNQNFKIYNNTLHKNSIVMSNVSDLTGTELKNNIFTKFAWSINGLTIPIENNALTETDYTGKIPSSNMYVPNLKFTDPLNYDFSLDANSPLIDAGAKLPPYTDGFLGNAPDIGALERGKPAFVGGALVRPSDVANIIVTYDNASFPDKKFMVSGLPIGRKIAANTKLKIGTAPSGGTREFDYVSNTTTFTNVPVGNLTGVQNIYLDLGQEGLYKTNSTIDLGTANPAGLEDEEKESFTIFPNPSNGSFEIGISENIQKVQIFSSSGLMVYEGTTKNIETVDLQKGLYIVYAYGTNKVFQTKLVIR